MDSRSTTKRGTQRAAEPTVSADAAVERQLWAALEAADSQETRFHLRQALQLVGADDGPHR
ncbi:hypothetical protein ACOZ4L_07890 [Haloplanus ruber]|uniref:Uncharacterized protein n=1 Tax=Haloplanus ruber TaxID=869892 RepID=A0ABD6CUI0_9EURY|nr:hypothetical protein [Haloplanus ruber]